MLVDIFLRKVVAKIDAFVVKQLFRLVILVLLAASLVTGGACTRILVIASEAKQGIRINFSLVDFARVNNVEMGLQLVLSLKSHVTLLFTLLVRAQKVRAAEVNFQALIIVVVHVSIMLPA